MKFICLASALVLATNAHKISQRSSDEVDDLLAKQDKLDAKETTDKEFNDANSKVSMIGQVSKDHSASEDEDYMQSVFDSYAKPGTDKRGNSNGYDVLTKDAAFSASSDIIEKWNDLPEANTKKYLE